jgi:hypothetical protein
MRVDIVHAHLAIENGRIKVVPAAIMLTGSYGRNVIEQCRPSGAKVGVIEPDTDLRLCATILLPKPYYSGDLIIVGYMPVKALSFSKSGSNIQPFSTRAPQKRVAITLGAHRHFALPTKV